MKLKYLYIGLLTFFLPVLASGQTGGKSFIEPLVKKDTVTVADQLEYGVVIDTLEKGCLPLFPELQGEGVEFLSDWKFDTLDVNKPEPGDSITYKLRGAVRFTSFDAGTYQLPEIMVTVRNFHGNGFDTLRFEGASVEFMDIPVDTASFVPHELKSPLEYPPLPRPFPWKIVLIVAASLLGVAAIVLLVWYLLRKKAARQESEHKDPAYIVALRNLEGFRGKKLEDHEKQKWFYSGITEVLREYINETYGVSAPEMTTAEIFAALKDKDIPEDMQHELKDLFERADFVKFAKHMASDMENAAALPLAIRFVSESYQRELEKETAGKSGKTAEEDRVGTDENGR